VYFDNLQVRHDRGRILEQNHYYAFILKIQALSSKAFGGAPNNYQYQGDYSEFDDDLGWNDFALRSYDPQLGRFLQHDPYDQFASGYVGMGNDPGNGTDPTGGLFGVGGSGCAAAAGMSGYGGMAGRIAGAGNFMKVVSTVSTVASAAAKGMGLGSSIEQNSKVGDPVPKSPPSKASQQWAEEITRKVSKGKVRPSPNPLLLLVYLLFSPSDANSNIDDTRDGIGGWKKLERERLEQEQAEDNYENRNPDKQVKYVTYTKVLRNPDGTTTTYSGRTSGSADESSEDIVIRRDAQHKNNFRLIGYGGAVVDQEDVGSKKDPTAKWAIRGREQQLIDRWGRAQRDDSGTSGNIIRGVSKYNPAGRLYHQSANSEWGELFRFTGY